MQLLAWCLGVVVVFLADEAKDEAMPPIELVEIKRESPIAFDKDIFPILEAKCVTCHDREGGLAEGDLDLLTVANLTKGGKHGPAIVVGKGDESLLFQAAGHRRKPIMPPKDEGDPLTPEELSLLREWINRGAMPGEDLSPGASRQTQITLKSLPADFHPASAVRYSADGTWLTVGQGNSALVIDSASGEIRARLAGHQDVIQSIAVSPDSSLIAAGSYEVIKVWTRVAGDATGKNWDGPRDLGPVKDRVLGLAFSPDGKILAASSGSPTAGARLHFWSMPEGSGARMIADVHSDTVTSLAFSPDGTTLATSSADKFMKLYSVADGKLVKSFEGHTGYVTDVAWKADGKWLATASADKTVKIWNVESGEQARTIGGHAGEITAIEFIATGPQIVTTCSDRVCRLGNAENGKIDRVLEGATDYLISVDVSKDGQTVVAGSQDGHVYFWKVADGSLIRTIDPPKSDNPAP